MLRAVALAHLQELLGELAFGLRGALDRQVDLHVSFRTRQLWTL
jgi:hypothetical protein